MKRPGYREAVEWLVCNDDCYWLSFAETQDNPIISVAAALVRDLFGVDDEKLFSDMRRAMKRNNHPAIS